MQASFFLTQRRKMLLQSVIMVVWNSCVVCFFFNDLAKITSVIRSASVLRLVIVGNTENNSR